MSRADRWTKYKWMSLSINISRHLRHHQTTIRHKSKLNSRPEPLLQPFTQLFYHFNFHCSQVSTPSLHRWIHHIDAGGHKPRRQMPPKRQSKHWNRQLRDYAVYDTLCRVAAHRAPTARLFNGNGDNRTRFHYHKKLETIINGTNHGQRFSFRRWHSWRAHVGGDAAYINFTCKTNHVLGDKRQTVKIVDFTIASGTEVVWLPIGWGECISWKFFDENEFVGW